MGSLRRIACKSVDFAPAEELARKYRRSLVILSAEASQATVPAIVTADSGSNRSDSVITWSPWYRLGVGVSTRYGVQEVEFWLKWVCGCGFLARCREIKGNGERVLWSCACKVMMKIGRLTERIRRLKVSPSSRATAICGEVERGKKRTRSGSLAFDRCSVSKEGEGEANLATKSHQDNGLNCRERTASMPILHSRLGIQTDEGTR